MGDPKTHGEPLRRNSPLFNAGRLKAPPAVLQEADDPRVLQSNQVRSSQRKERRTGRYIVFFDEGYGFRKRANEIKGYGTVLAFSRCDIAAPAGRRSRLLADVSPTGTFVPLEIWSRTVFLLAGDRFSEPGRIRTP